MTEPSDKNSTLFCVQMTSAGKSHRRTQIVLTEVRALAKGLNALRCNRLWL